MTSFTNIFDWSTWYLCENIHSEHLNYTTELIATFIIANNLQNVSSIHQRKLFYKSTFHETIQNNTRTMKYSNLWHSCYAHWGSNACNWQKFKSWCPCTQHPKFQHKQWAGHGIHHTHPILNFCTHKHVETLLPMLPWLGEQQNLKFY